MCQLEIMEVLGDFGTKLLLVCWAKFVEMPIWPQIYHFGGKFDNCQCNFMCFTSFHIEVLDISY